MGNPERYWEPEVVARRLVRLQRGEGSVLFVGYAGLVRARCLRAGELWELRPYQGDAWRWVMVGEKLPGRWSVLFSDGAAAPERIREAELSAYGALWDALEFLHWDVKSE